MRDLRQYARQTTFRLIVGSLLILFIIGLGLVAWLYGLPAAGLGLLCLLSALLPIGLILLTLALWDWIVKHGRS
ncbi:hypothetical protein SE15_05575 [Thermanaerothrix daxensis]|uniref:Uncharacterized protein n=1 Tax=Thermanaerothrix daxensis TaxID=869279 RepID=A0A0P6XPM9_9CHLR|nr:hypothetical protein [Thermanaerothrix daxensis]KPL84549.1 hypothetical protein SE15_05575 [Thermanaerothrix daxensis]